MIVCDSGLDFLARDPFTKKINGTGQLFSVLVVLPIFSSQLGSSLTFFGSCALSLVMAVHSTQRVYSNGSLHTSAVHRASILAGCGDVQGTCICLSGWVLAYPMVQMRFSTSGTDQLLNLCLTLLLCY